MKKSFKYQIENFYVGELYLYTVFGNLLAGNSITESQSRVESFSRSGAINFQKDLINRYIDWENRREYTGFLTIFYKQDNKYICLHDGKVYELNTPNIIDNLVPLNELLPKIDTKKLSKISMYEALELFDILFKEECPETVLYKGEDKPIADFYVGDVALRERTPLGETEERCRYIDLPHHLILERTGLDVYSFGRKNYASTVYRCLFLKDGVDLYNVNNHQFYNPNEDHFDSIVSFKEYMEESEIKTPSKTITIPKALKLFKRTIDQS